MSPVLVGDSCFSWHVGLPSTLVPPTSPPSSLILGPVLGEQASEPPIATVLALTSQGVHTPHPPTQSPMVSGKCLWPHCSSHLMAWPRQPLCILHITPGESLEPSVWVWDAGVLESRCLALPGLDASSAHFEWREQELVVPWSFPDSCLLLSTWPC